MHVNKTCALPRRGQFERLWSFGPCSTLTLFVLCPSLSYLLRYITKSYCDQLSKTVLKKGLNCICIWGLVFSDTYIFCIHFAAFVQDKYKLFSLFLIVYLHLKEWKQKVVKRFSYIDVFRICSNANTFDVFRLVRTCFTWLENTLTN